MDASEIHRFLECNLPEYERRDLIRVLKAFCELLGWDKKHPLKSVGGKRWKPFKEFVCQAWQGTEETNKKPARVPAPKPPPEFGFCTCGGHFVKRQNRAKGNFFLGCSKYPKCKQTQNFEL